MSTDLTTWWSDLAAAALVGTARRPVPPLPSLLGEGRADAAKETTLLDAAALGGALRRAGVRTGRPEPVGPAADDCRPAPPPRAVQLLELLLHQSPVGSALRPHLVLVWLDTADGGGHRAPHHLLPDLLALAGQHARLRSAVRRVADARGSWLAAANPEWQWVAEDGTAVAVPAENDPESWARRSTDQRVSELVILRKVDPDAGRALVESAWGQDPPGDRARLLSALRTGLGEPDEPLLERALDDRSSKVRAAAVTLLDALPTSARATRMAARLEPLLQVKGLLRKQLAVELPLDPDPAGVRDGLVRPKRVGSVRGWWLQRLAAGAPLEVWTAATGVDVASTWRMIDHEDARVGIVEAVLARGDSVWAAAVVNDVWHPGLLALLAKDRLDDLATRQLAAATAPDRIIAVLEAVPIPWGPSFSRAVLRRLMAEKDPALLVGHLTERLARGLDPTTQPTVQKWLGGLEGGARDRVARISQYLALVPEIPEAFR